MCHDPNNIEFMNTDHSNGMHPQSQMNSTHAYMGDNSVNIPGIQKKIWNKIKWFSVECHETKTKQIFTHNWTTQPISHCIKPNQSNCMITFDTRLKTTLWSNN